MFLSRTMATSLLLTKTLSNAKLSRTLLSTQSLVKHSFISLRSRIFDNLLTPKLNKPMADSFAPELAKGSVLLVGAGPGDPDLLTVKALKAIQQADTVLVDWLVDKRIVALIPAHVQQIFVGKRAGKHSMSQSNINKLLVDLALSGKKVVRLKGGDPAIFGRSAEELQALQEHSIEFAIVPGITAASGASAYSGIPLTHREHAQSLRLVTAHFKTKEGKPDWTNLVSALDSETQVFYMGLGRLRLIVESMLDAGLRNDMPIVVIDQATTEQQRICRGNADTIAKQVERAKFTGPSLIIMGEAVAHSYSISPKLLRELNVTAPAL